MTPNGPNIAGTLSDRTLQLWEAAERGQTSPIEELGTDPVQIMLRVLALQNAGSHAPALDLAQSATALPAPFGMWAKAEATFAARVRASRALAPAEQISLREADALAGSADPWAALAAGRAYLALGLLATQDNRLTEADNLLARAAQLMHSTGSRSGGAVVNLELGKLRSWQGNADEALKHLLSALAVWRDLNEEQSTAVWQQVGSLLLDTRNFSEAASVLESAFRRDGTTRTRNTLTRALIGCQRFEEAEGHARAVLEQEGAQRASTTIGHDNYRETMAHYDLAQIKLLQRASLLRRARSASGLAESETSVAELLEEAEQHFRSALDLENVRTSVNDSLFTAWIGPLDRASRSVGEAKGLDFRQLRLAQLELTIASQKRPGEAARNLAKLADVFGQRGERIQELEAREQSAMAWEWAEEPLQAAQAYEQAMRSAELAGSHASARAMRIELARIVASSGRFGPERPDYLVRGVDLHVPCCTVLGATEVSSGRRVRIYTFSVPEALRERAVAGLSALRTMHADGRVLPGMPRLLASPPDAANAGATFDVVTDAVEGEPVSVAMNASRGNWRRAVRIIRDVSYTVGVLRAAGLADCRPAPDHIFLDLSDNPVCLDILPLRAGPASSPEEEVRHLATMLAEWITGEKPRTRSIGFGAGQMRLIFDTKHQVPEALNVLLSSILLPRQSKAVSSPNELANRLQPYCA